MVSFGNAAASGSMRMLLGESRTEHAYTAPSDSPGCAASHSSSPRSLPDPIHRSYSSCITLARRATAGFLTDAWVRSRWKSTRYRYSVSTSSPLPICHRSRSCSTSMNSTKRSASSSVAIAFSMPTEPRAYAYARTRRSAHRRKGTMSGREFAIRGRFGVRLRPLPAARLPCRRTHVLVDCRQADQMLPCRVRTPLLRSARGRRGMREVCGRGQQA